MRKNSQRVDNIWMAHPTTEASRIDSIVKTRGNLLLVFYKTRDDPLERSRQQYFYNLKMSQGAYLLDGQRAFEQMAVERKTSTPGTVDVTESLYVPENSVLLKKFTFEKPASEWFIYECRGG